MKLQRKKKSITATRTYTLLRNTLLELLERSSFEKISLLELCDAAMIPRSTFYHYFEDKYDLLRYCMKTSFEEAGLNEDVIFFRSIESIRTFLLAIIHYADANKLQYQKIYIVNKDGALINLFRDYMMQLLSEKLHESEKYQNNELVIACPIFAALLADFYFSIIKCYLEQGDCYDFESFVENVCLFVERNFFSAD